MFIRIDTNSIVCVKGVIRFNSYIHTRDKNCIRIVWFLYELWYEFDTNLIRFWHELSIRIAYMILIRIVFTNFVYEFDTNCIRITYELYMNLYEFWKVTIRINLYAVYRISYQYRIMLRIPYTNLIRIFGDDLLCDIILHQSFQTMLKPSWTYNTRWA